MPPAAAAFPAIGAAASAIAAPAAAAVAGGLGAAAATAGASALGSVIGGSAGAALPGVASGLSDLATGVGGLGGGIGGEITGGGIGGLGDIGSGLGGVVGDITGAAEATGYLPGLAPTAGKFGLKDALGIANIGLGVGKGVAQGFADRDKLRAYREASLPGRARVPLASTGRGPTGSYAQRIALLQNKIGRV